MPRYNLDGPLPICVCTDCNQGLAYDDWSHVDFYLDGEQAELEHARLSARVVELGWLTPIGHDDEVLASFECDVCSRIVDGEIAHDTCSYWQGEA
jgi:hypothetical protein